MPYEIKLERLPAGYALSASREGQKVQVCQREFVSSEDGDRFISRLEGLPASILEHLPEEVKPSNVDHLLAIIRKDKTATVYVNELTFEGRVRIRRSVSKGDLIFQSDILDVERLHIPNVAIPDDAGVVLILSSGWRKGLYFDLTPLHSPKLSKRGYDFERLCGQFWVYLTFQNILKIDDPTWRTLLAQRWFPFIYLGYPLIKEMIEYARNNWQVDELLADIRQEVKQLIDNVQRVWRKNSYFSPHTQLIERALDRFREQDWVSTSSILYPRIEGVMRSYLNNAGITRRPSPKYLVSEVIRKNSRTRHSCSMLLPERFQTYLDDVYFAHFDPGSDPNIGRHSIAHGEARADSFDEKSSILAILTLYQLALFLSPDQASGPAYKARVEASS